MRYFHDVYGVDYGLYEVVITDDSSLIGKSLDDIESAYRIRVIASKRQGGETRFGPGTLARDTELQAGITDTHCQESALLRVKYMNF